MVCAWIEPGRSTKPDFDMFLNDYVSREAVAPDGKAMSQTIVWLNINGKPEITTNPFVRIP
jgi:hypothetical protein